MANDYGVKVGEHKTSLPTLTDGDKNELQLDVNGRLLVRTDVNYDSVSVDYPTSDSEVYSFYSGGLAGTLVSTVTVTYTDSTKNNIESVVRV